MKCYEVVENEKQMVILMEWLRGGHLLDTLEEMAGQHYSEQQAAILFVQVRSVPSLVTPGTHALRSMHSWRRSCDQALAVTCITCTSHPEEPKLYTLPL